MTSIPPYHLPLKWMGDFKAVAIDYEYYLTLSATPQSVCLTERQMYVLSVQNTYTAWLTRWYNTDDITQKTVQFIAAEIEGILTMCNCGVPIPSNTDIINTNTYITSTSNDYVTNNVTYTTDGNTLDTLAPNMTYAIGDTPDIDRVLCFGYEMMIKTIIEQGKGVKQLESGQEQDLVRQIGIAMGALSAAGGLAMAAGGFAATVVAVIGGPWALLGLAIGGIATGIASLFIAADVSLFEDTIAIEEVLCTLRTNSFEHEPTFATFSGLLSPNTFVVDSNAEKLAAVVQPFLDSLDFYLQFMISMSQLYATPLLVALPECEFCPVPPLYCLDFGVSAHGWQPYPGGYGVRDSGGLAGEFYVGDGLYYFIWTTSGTVAGDWTEIILSFSGPIANFQFMVGGLIAGSIGATASNTLTINASTADPLIVFPLNSAIGWQMRVTGDTVSSTFRVSEQCGTVVL